MPDVVALDLEARAVLGAGRQDVFDVREGVLEDAVARAFQIRLFPGVLELALEAREHRVEAEIHRAHVERGDLRLERRGRAHALLDRHRRRAAGRDVDDGFRALLDDLQERREGFRRLIGAAVLRVARMQMHHRGAGFRGADRRIGDLARRDRDMRRHRRRVDRAGDRAGDDDFLALGHCSSRYLVVRSSEPNLDGRLHVWKASIGNPAMRGRILLPHRRDVGPIARRSSRTRRARCEGAWAVRTRPCRPRCAPRGRRETHRCRSRSPGRRSR